MYAVPQMQLFEKCRQVAKFSPRCFARPRPPAHAPPPTPRPTPTLVHISARRTPPTHSWFRPPPLHRATHYHPRHSPRLSAACVGHGRATPAVSLLLLCGAAVVARDVTPPPRDVIAKDAAASAAMGDLDAPLRCVTTDCMSATTRWITESHRVRQTSLNLRENDWLCWPRCVARERTARLIVRSVSSTFTQTVSVSFNDAEVVLPSRPSRPFRASHAHGFQRVYGRHPYAVVMLLHSADGRKPPTEPLCAVCRPPCLAVTPRGLIPACSPRTRTA